MNATLRTVSTPRFDPRAESQLREVRRLLGFAKDVWPLDLEVADSFVARAANRLAAAIRLSERGTITGEQA